ncbi:MAG: VTT domain-containing protein [Thiohalocapsa sp.]|nr:VTT domain-containing protein [Thiohalocapsa sp.]
MADDALPAAASSEGLALEPGRNCWRVAHAARVGVAVDGECYFAAARRSMIAARRWIAIAAWDIHSRIGLDRSEDPGDGLPRALGELLVALLERREELEVFILLWDYASIYALEREPLFFGDGPWDGHPRLHFVKDDAHPVAASQHQKLVLVDGKVAWCGGFDLSKWRWDTNAHRAQEPRRRDPDGDLYPPFHDIQLLVDDEAAAALTDLFRERWQRAAGAPPELPAVAGGAAQDDGDPWPAGMEVVFRDRPVAIARTLPEISGRAEVRESEHMALDLIDGARSLLYLQNQYLTSRTVRDALCRALRRADGPEIVIIVPRETGHWLEQHTMDILRARVMSALRDSDERDRLRIYYPDVRGLRRGCLMVHSKLMIADDRVLRVGSSNLSNRSMGLDSECDLCIVARDDSDRDAITALRRRLLAMFLSVDPDAVADAEMRTPNGDSGTIEAIEALKAGREAGSGDDGPPLTLTVLGAEVDPEWDRQLPDERLIDPDRPLGPDLLADVVIGGADQTPDLRRRLLIGASVLVLFLLLAAAWRWTPLGDWLRPNALAAAVSELSEAAWGPPLLIVGFIAASLVAVPVTLLILVSALVFGPLTGSVVALVGSTLSAIAGYGIGWYSGRRAVQQMAGSRLEGLSRRIARHGILTMVTVRIVPVAPFAVLNLFAGASHVSLRDFIIGTVVGMTPGILAISVFAEGLLSLAGRADMRAVGLVIAGLLAIGGLLWLGQRLMKTGE